VLNSHGIVRRASSRLETAAAAQTRLERRVREPSRQLRMLQALLDLDVTSLDLAMQRAARDLSEVLATDKVDVFVYEPASDALVAIGTSDTPMGRLQHALGLNRMPLAAGGRAVRIFQAGLDATQIAAD
jgi:two-component system, OmpR family, sensor kinase